MSFGHALYYPHINLTNKNWIKHSLLFWDKISRIVPYSVELSDSEDIIRIKDESGFIEDYHPEKWDTSRTFQDFSQTLKHIIESDTFFNERYFERSRSQRRYMNDYGDKREFFTEMVQASGTYIHIQKLDHRLKDYLYDIGIAIPGRDQYEDWIKIDNEIGLLYMTYFAKTISKNKTLPILTDVEQSFSAAIHFESAINSDYNSQFEYKLGNLMIESIVPKSINNVPLDKILEIRNKYDNERSAYLEQISALSNSIPEIDNPSALNDAINHHSKLIAKETKQLEKLYNSFNIDVATKFLSISIPSTITSLTEYVPDNSKPYLASGGVLFGIISAANTIKKEKLQLKKNPQSYLLNLKSELTSDKIFHKINDTVKGVRNW